MTHNIFDRFLHKRRLKTHSVLLTLTRVVLRPNAGFPETWNARAGPPAEESGFLTAKRQTLAGLIAHVYTQAIH